MNGFRFNQRRAGILLHPTSLPAGHLGDGSLWLDFLASNGMGMWQVLPLGIPQNSLSPYQALSAFAVDPKLFGGFEQATARQLKEPAFRNFCQQQQHWLDDFARFMRLRELHGQSPWYQWPEPYRNAQQSELAEFDLQQAGALDQIKWQQFQCYSQWQQLKLKAHSQQIGLFGDMPIFVAHDSADVWAHPERFLLNAQGQPEVVTGVPPDYFSETGQRWGNPHYNWNRMEAEGFSWWLQRLRYALEWFDLIRIDHFRGLEAAWQIPADATTAISGRWVAAPGAKLLTMLQQEMAELPLVAEDLGIITREVRALKQLFDLPGMSVLQFGFDYFEDNPHKPANITPRTVVYTGTHDNDTLLGWFSSLESDAKRHVLNTLELESSDQLVNRVIEAAMESQAALAMFPLQDLLGLGSEARMNTPGTIEGNWQWRFEWPQLEPPELGKRIRRWIDASNRRIRDNRHA